MALSRGRAQRLKRRKLRELGVQLKLARKEQARLEQARLLSLPKRERELLTSTRVKSGSLDRDFLMSRTHFKGCSVTGQQKGAGTVTFKVFGESVTVSKSLPSGSTLNFAGHRSKKNKGSKGQGPRFAPSFMAKGHEELKAPVVIEYNEIKVPPSKKFVRV